MEIFERDTGFEILKYLDFKYLISICEEMGIDCYQIYAYTLKYKFNIDPKILKGLPIYEIKKKFYSLVYQDLSTKYPPIIISQEMLFFMGLKNNITNKKFYYEWWMDYLRCNNSSIDPQIIEPDECIKDYFNFDISVSLNDFIKFLNSHISRKTPYVPLATLLEWS